MDRSLFKFILRYSSRQQMFLLGLIVVSYPLSFLLYDIPKAIINRAIGAGEDPPFSAKFFGIEVPFFGSQIEFLLILCFAFLSVVIINNGLKFYINVYKGRLAERLLRRLRYMLYSRVLRFPLPHFKKVSQGELISMISAEAEQVGNFTAGAVADPAFLGGQWVVALGFILLQDWRLGAAALALYPTQIYVVPRMQKKVSQLAKARLREIRRLSDHIGESVSGIVDVHAHDTSQYELSRFTNRLGIIFNIRYELFRRKYSIKFLNNFIDKLAPFFFYLIGGILVIQGSLTLGALVAVLAAHKDMAAPWKELLNWYQQREDARAKYDQIVSQFDPDNMFDEELQTTEPEELPALSGEIGLSNVGFVDEDEIRRLANLTISLGLGKHVAVVGTGGSGKDYLALMLARLSTPTSGKVTVCGQNLTALPTAVTGRRISYVGQNAFLQSASVRENLLYGLKHRPQRPAEYDDREAAERETDIGEAQRSGNLELDYRADWVDLAAVGVEDGAELFDRMVEALDVVDLSEDAYHMGLRGTVDPTNRPGIAESVLAARHAVRERLNDPAYQPLVEPFDRELYNTNATVAENLLFGSPVGADFDMERLAENAYVLRVLDKAGLRDDLLEIGRQVAQTMVEIFADLPPGHEFFEQYSFISSDDLPEYQLLLARAERGPLAELQDEDRVGLLSLPFKIIPGRHRLGLIDEPMQKRLLEARRIFAQDLPPEVSGSVEFFDPEKYNAAASLQDNILFGKLAYGQAQAAQMVGALITETLDALGLRGSVMEAGLDFQVGVGGSRLSTVQRQKLAFARALLKRPDLLIVNEAASVLDNHSQKMLAEKVLRYRAEQGVIWILSSVELAELFAEVVVLKDGRLAGHGAFVDLNREGTALSDLLQSG
ncbi:MAG: ABC transporter transmembrane domain-containing protein [Alphaproteobacteria bacterium]